MATSNGTKHNIGNDNDNRKTTAQEQFLCDMYPVNSMWEMMLENKEKVEGRVYCTDEISRSIVLQKPLVHTTLASEVRIINADAIVSAHRSPADDDNNNNNNESTDGKNSPSDAVPLSKPLPKINKKTLEERERKALRIAEEGFKHINEKASSKGQACFERLLKACGDVIWKDESILVLNQIQIDPPYDPDNCNIVARTGLGGKKALEDGSLERVKKIVAAVSSSISNK